MWYPKEMPFLEYSLNGTKVKTVWHAIFPSVSSASVIDLQVRENGIWQYYVLCTMYPMYYCTMNRCFLFYTPVLALSVTLALAQNTYTSYLCCYKFNLLFLFQEFSYYKNQSFKTEMFFHRSSVDKQKFVLTQGTIYFFTLSNRESML